MRRLTKTRLKVLRRVEEDAQSFRIARCLHIAQTSVQSALQWARRSGLVEYRSRWLLTPAGRAKLAEER